VVQDFERERFRRQIEKASESAREVLLLAITEKIEGLRNVFESPLEESFYVWWVALEQVVSGGNILVQLDPQFPVVIGDEHYRLDFRVKAWKRGDTAGNYPKIAVEVDGHEFHERTREQVALRDARDRALQKDGWVVFHYSWSEFFADPLGKVAEVYFFARKTIQGLARRSPCVED
jgi:hypothetical protein